MHDETPTSDPHNDDEPLPLNYARPRLIRRYQNGPVWKAIVRVVGGLLVTMFFVVSIGRTFMMPLDAWIAIVGGVGLAALMGLIAWERGMILKEPIWEGSKDLRAQTYRASASRFDSSGVRIVDPQPPGNRVE